MFFRKNIKIESLNDCLEFAFRMLEKGASQYRHAFHFPALISGDPHGVEARIVILRSFSKQERYLLCHSDIRSAKIRQIQNNSRVSWLFYDPKKAFQLRISGKAKLHTKDALADEQWNTVRITSRMNYLTPLPPGHALDSASSGLSGSFSEKVMNSLNKDAGRENFALIKGRIENMDWLVLGMTGHRRAQFSWRKEELKASWVVP
ncbi:MAG: pyridoxamine 5'-phosphate oxidase family protein [Proteobacteria bacterium]|nr:pyridoxamine 5'-phosphate oxidase family protein [Pseudomonadota bacterium]